MKQITIYDLLPLLKKGWVAKDFDNIWHWFKTKPVRCKYHAGWYDPKNMRESRIIDLFNIAPFDGDWKDSLIKVEHKEEE